MFIRRIGPGKDIGPTPAILGSIKVPTTVGTRAQFVEPSGNVMFQVERFDPDGRVVKTNSKEAVVWLMISVLGLSVDF